MLKIVFMGTPQFSVPILEALIKTYNVIGVVTQPDKEVGRKRLLTPSPIKVIAEKHQIKVFQPQRIRKDFQDIIDLNPDLIVTAAYGQIVGMKLLNTPKYRSINVHASLLPKYRGGAPIHQAIKMGEKETGITIMYMEKEMDAGDILAQRIVEIKENDTCGTMFEKLSFVGRDLLLETIPKLVKGEIIPLKQNESEATFAYNITKKDEKIDFSQNAKDIYNHIRAYNPAPIAYMELNGDIIKIYQAKISDQKHQGPFGKIIGYNKTSLLISCGDGSVLEILELQPAGKSRMSAASFINGHLKKYL